MNSIIYSASFKRGMGKGWKIIVTICCIALFLFVLSLIPVSEDDFFKCNIFFLPVLKREYRYNEYTYDYYWEDWHREVNFTNVLFGICALILVLVAVYFLILKNNIIKGCTLNLNTNTVSGSLKRITSSKEVQLPFENISSIAIRNNILDKILAGKTILIASSSGMIKFQSVENADEFVSKALAEIEKYKKNIAQNTASGNAMPVQNSSTFDKINELKAMLESGLITQDEFDEKRKELLSKM